ncbi:MAG: CaiB/BaiF CoA-transferase family protein [Deltaproteobacteria bacterium]|nr:CaiB/BaiF CoA-transferase family protein [Deltaproteobacteria bacterium]
MLRIPGKRNCPNAFPRGRHRNRELYPGVTQKLGIDYETLRQGHQELLYCSVSGFGQYGPYKNKRAYDPIIQGMTGLMSITGDKNGPPAKVGIPITDLVAGLYAVISLQSAYVNRLNDGKGQYIDVALYDSMISLLTIVGMEYFATGKAPKRWGIDHMHRVPARAFETRDKQYIQVAATNEVMYPKFCRVIGLPELIDDPRFVTNKKRVENRAEIMPILEEKIRQKDRDEWFRLFEKANLPYGPILGLDEVFADENIRERGMFFTMEHPIENEIPQLGFPFKMSLTPPNARLRPPTLGEHNTEILVERLNYTMQELGKLKEESVI